jgi:hypothetical protein
VAESLSAGCEEPWSYMVVRERWHFALVVDGRSEVEMVSLDVDWALAVRVDLAGLGWSRFATSREREWEFSKHKPGLCGSSSLTLMPCACMYNCSKYIRIAKCSICRKHIDRDEKPGTDQSRYSDSATRKSDSAADP